MNKRRTLIALLSGAAIAFATVQPASAEEFPEKTFIARVSGKSSKSVTLQPFHVDSDVAALWDLKVPVDANTVVTGQDGAPIAISKIKSGSVVRVSATTKVTSWFEVYGCGTLITGKYGCGHLLVPRKVYGVKGSVRTLNVLPGVCATKRTRLGGKGEKVKAAVCRYQESGAARIVVAIDASDADHTSDVIASLGASNAQVRISLADGTGFPVTAGLNVAEKIAAAALTADSIPAGSKVRIEIFADGPHDGKDAMWFTVSKSSRL